MFAVLKTGGKQYRVQPGDVLRVEKLAALAGEKVQFNEILMVGTTVGSPLVDGAGVQAEVLDQIKGPKTINFVKRRRKHSSQRTRGHRQQLTVLRVTEILESGADATGVKAAINAGSAPADARLAAAAPSTPAEAPAAPAAPVGSKPANLLDAPRDGTTDALKSLQGLGPKAEASLNAAGIYHFDQLASWSADEIAYIEGQTGLKADKLSDWAAQAKSAGQSVDEPGAETAGVDAAGAEAPEADAPQEDAAAAEPEADAQTTEASSADAAETSDAAAADGAEDSADDSVDTGAASSDDTDTDGATPDEKKE